MVQTCVVHLIRAAMRFVAYQDRKKVAAALKPIYTAPNEETARKALAEFEASELGTKYPSALRDLGELLGAVHPVPAVPTHAPQGHLHDQQHRVAELPATEGDQEPRPLPLDRGGGEGLLWLAICNIEDKRAAERARDRGKPAGQRKAQGRLVEGQAVTNWKQALAQLAAAYPDRINPYL